MRSFRFRLASAAAMLLGLVATGQAQNGWTALSPSTNSRVVYVSSSTGSDSNNGLGTATPVRSISRGYSLLRDGFPDWLVLKAGDTWNETFPSFDKSANSTSAYMVVGMYGSGPRPRIVVPPSTNAFYSGGNTPRRGLAIVDLDMTPSAPGSGGAGLILLNVWQHVLIEGCRLVGFSDNIVVQDVNWERQSDIRIRRCVLADSTNIASGHSQGIFMRCVDNWTIEGCVFDYNGRLGTGNTMFRHNVYVHETCGSGTFNDNVSARASSHGAQQRPGGVMQNNLFLQNSLNAYQGSAANVSNTFRYNVALDGKNINELDQRGMGFVLSGDCVVEYNVAAHQQTGTGLGTVKAFEFDGFNNGTIRGNVVYDWRRPGAGDGTAYGWNGGLGSVLFENNAAYQPAGGMCIRHDTRPLTSLFNYRNNRYWTINPFAGYAPFATFTGVGADWNTWHALAGEPNTVFASVPLADVRIDAYLASISYSGSVPEFMAQAREQSRSYWRTQFTAPVVNDWVRSRFGLPQVGGGGPPTCLANCDGSTIPPILNILDLMCFFNNYAVQSPAANCDGSSGSPMITPNDWTCFWNLWVRGCQ